jgi:mono/diheme cytochrome c family protein
MMLKRLWPLVVLLAIVMSLALAACGGSDADESRPADAPAAVASGDAAKGKEIFSTTCFACHGEGGVGVQGLGKSMVESTFIAGLNDEELLTFIKSGRDTGNPDNTTGVAMPPKGGNPALTDDQLKDVIAYVRTLNTVGK